MKPLKRIFLIHLIIVGLLFSTQLWAQYSFSPSKVIDKYQNFNRLSYDSIHIANNTADTLHLRWELIQYDTVGGSYFDFCSSGVCFIGFPGSGSFPDIVPYGYGYSGAHFWTGNVAVTCTAKIWVYPDGNFAAGDTLTYILHATDPNGIENSEETDNTISVFLNSATGKIVVNFNSNILKEYHLRCYNISGEEVFATTSTKSCLEISTNGFAKGIYFFHIATGNKNFIKKFVY